MSTHASAPLPRTVALVEEQYIFSVTALCRATGARADELSALVGEGVLHPIGGPDDALQFADQALPRTLTALRLARDFDLAPAGVALVMDLLDEIERLRARLRRG
jgi:chaperone modulatory protein CbpM